MVEKKEDNQLKDSFIFYRSFFEALSALGGEDRLELYDAICNLALNQMESELKPISKAIFGLIKPQIEANHKRYLNGFKGREYGKLGGRPKTQTKPQQNPKETPEKPQGNPSKTPAKPQQNPKETPAKPQRNPGGVISPPKSQEKSAKFIGNNSRKLEGFTPQKIQENSLRETPKKPQINPNKTPNANVNVNDNVNVNVRKKNKKTGRSVN
jgi:hypothetical protein